MEHVEGDGGEVVVAGILITTCFLLIMALVAVLRCLSKSPSDGALAGQAIGGNTKGTLIGAGIGALGGYIVGNEMDKKREKEQAAARANNPAYNQQQQQKDLQAENERLRAEIENEQLRRQLEAERDD